MKVPVVEDHPVVAEDHPVVAEDHPAVVEDHPVVGEDHLVEKDLRTKIVGGGRRESIPGDHRNIVGNADVGLRYPREDGENPHQ